MTLEPFEISSWNFHGSTIRSKLGLFWKWLHSDALRCMGGDL